MNATPDLAHSRFYMTMLRAAGLGRSLLWLLLLILTSSVAAAHPDTPRVLAALLDWITLLYALGVIATSLIAIFDPVLRQHWWRF